MTTITFIGPGVMAEGLIAGILREKLAPADDLRVSGPRPRRGEFLHQTYGVAGFSNNAAAIEGVDVIVLSIKPQSLEAVMLDLAGKIGPDALVLSIIAGAPIKKLTRGLKHTSIVRAMPNTPAQIGKGITVWTSAPDVTDSQREFARRILAALGREIFMEDEKYLDMATALSGTGPAYVFLFMEAMVDAGVHLGFPRRIAEALVVETVRGSVEYYLGTAESRPAHLAGMRNDVTSPGGTTAAALYFLEKAGFRTAISRAIWAAYERSQELGKDAKSHAPEN
jgi:pyrroline-5-carboxylate reductase